MVQGFSLLSVSTNLRSSRAVLHRFGSAALGCSAPPLNRSVRHKWQTQDCRCLSARWRGLSGDNPRYPLIGRSRVMEPTM